MALIASGLRARQAFIGQKFCPASEEGCESSEVEDNGDGSYLGNFTVTYSGVYDLFVQVRAMWSM